MRKFLTYFIFCTLLLIPLGYAGFWYFSSWKIKNFLASVADNKNVTISYDTIISGGFPFNFIFHIKNPKLSSKQVTISSEVLTIKNKLFDKQMFLYTPSNMIDITFHDIGDTTNYKATCNIHNSNNLSILLKQITFSVNNAQNLPDYVNKLRYEDYGLKCSILNNDHKTITTQIDNGPNYLQLDFERELEKLGSTFLINQYCTEQNCFNINIKFGYEFIRNVSASKMNLDFNRFLIKNNDFLFNASGRIHDYNFVTMSFEKQVDINILGCKKFVHFLVGAEYMKRSPEVLNKMQNLICSLSEETSDHNMHFNIRYDSEKQSGIIGNISFRDFANQLQSIQEDSN
ncbi:hypothetical protein [Wolbachia endosymbiont of Pentidionis agamae]|uniref:hypothetical protein n=1 Tax=Wolbachia endosymbiont of Pentidionis agamae TaxID=3110435 RepID=UPI002FD40780